MNTALPKLSKAPVISIVGQVRFSSVLSIESQLPNIQEEFRRYGFPKFERTASQTFGLPPGTNPPVEYFWKFTDKNDQRIITLATNAITLHSALNDTPDDFDDIFFFAISTFYKFVQPDLIQRIGVRWVDVIQPSEGKDFSEYIHEGLLGIPKERLGASNSVWQFYSLSQTECGSLILQGRYPLIENFLPPDIVEPKLKLRLLEKRPSFVLDADHFLELNAEFNMDTIKGIVKSFHKVIVDRVFVSAVQPNALAEWQ